MTVSVKNLSRPAARFEPNVLIWHEGSSINWLDARFNGSQIPPRRQKSGWKHGKPEPFLVDRFNKTAAAFSPDGRWLAYESNESGRNVEVYVRPFPARDPRTLISAGGGTNPTWSRTSNELLYFNASENQFMVSRYTDKGSSFQAEKAVPRSKQAFTDHAPLTGILGRFFDLHADGKKLAVLTLPPAQAHAKQNTVSFFFNFFDELRRLSAGQR